MHKVVLKKLIELKNVLFFKKNALFSKMCIFSTILLERKIITAVVYCWLRAHATNDITCFPAFVEASDVISSAGRYVY